MEEKCVAYFYDKKTKMVVNVWRHSQRVGKTNEIIQEDCTPEMVETHKSRMQDDEPWSYMRDRLTDKDIDNLGSIHVPLLETPMSYLRIDESGPEAKLIAKPYLKLSMVSPEATFIKSRSWGPSSSKDFYTFPSDGVTQLELKLEAFESEDYQCKRTDADQKCSEFDHEVRVYVTRGRLDRKDGNYKLENGECAILWLLPDESICDAQIYVGHMHKDHVSAPYLCSNTINIDCV